MEASKLRKKELIDQPWRAANPNLKIRISKRSASKTIRLCRAVLELRELNCADYFYGDEIEWEFDVYSHLQKINPNPTIEVDPANYFVGLRNLLPLPAHLKPYYSRKKVLELKKERSQFLWFSKVFKDGYHTIRINGIMYESYAAIKKRLDELTAQLAL